jgi:hypothetical protein
MCAATSSELIPWWNYGFLFASRRDSLARFGLKPPKTLWPSWYSICQHVSAPSRGSPDSSPPSEGTNNHYVWLQVPAYDKSTYVRQTRQYLIIITNHSLFLTVLKPKINLCCASGCIFWLLLIKVRLTCFLNWFSLYIHSFYHFSFFNLR